VGGYHVRPIVLDEVNCSLFASEFG